MARVNVKKISNRSILQLNIPLSKVPVSSQIILFVEYALANLRQVIAPQRIFSDSIQTLVNHSGGEL